MRRARVPHGRRGSTDDDGAHEQADGKDGTSEALCSDAARDEDVQQRDDDGDERGDEVRGRDGCARVVEKERPAVALVAHGLDLTAVRGGAGFEAGVVRAGGGGAEAVLEGVEFGDFEKGCLGGWVGGSHNRSV